MTAGTARATPTATDRSDVRHILVSGTKVGGAVAAAVVGYLVVSRFIPAGIVREGVQTVVVLAGAVAAAFLPAQGSVARTTQGIASAAAIGLWGTIVFMAIDIVVLRPIKAYLWTWDAVGGGSSWWYLPIWWMLGTFVAWMGGMITAARAARGAATSIGALAFPVLTGTVALTPGLFFGFPILLPVAAGASFGMILTVLAVVAIARKS